MWMKLTPNECIERALQAPSQSIERQWWFDLAQLMLDATPIPPVNERYAAGGLTLQTGSLYRQQAGYSRMSRVERIHRYGISY